MKNTRRPTKRVSSTPSSPRSRASASSSRRTWTVVISLFGMLAFTGALLKALAPSPLTSDATVTLFGIRGEDSIERVFETSPAPGAGRWKYIFIHQSLTPSGNALSLSQDGGGLPDHFLIGNGDGLADGALQTGPRWSRQLAAGALPGVEMGDDCISICIVGDFNQARPTATQQARLLELVSALQRQLRIPKENVNLHSEIATSAGIGRRFPASRFLAQLDQWADSSR